MNVVEFLRARRSRAHRARERPGRALIVLSGDATMVIDGADHPAPAGTFVRLTRAAADGCEPERQRRDCADRLRPADERLHAAGLGVVRAPVTAACVQVEPAIFDRAATIDSSQRAPPRQPARAPSSSSSRRPSSPRTRPRRGRRRSPGWGDPGAKEAFAMLHRESLELPSPDADRLAGIAREHGVWLVTASTRSTRRGRGRSTTRSSTTRPPGELALHHRKLVPTNHERLVWGPGDGRGLRAIETPIGRLGGLICWENYMPLARFSLYESGDRDLHRLHRRRRRRLAGHARHIALESRSFVVSPCHFQRAAFLSDDFPLATLLEVATFSAAAAARSSARTAATSPARSTTRRGSSTPSSTRTGSPSRASASTRPATTTGRTCSR